MAVVICAGVLLAYAVRIARWGRPKMPRLGEAPGSALLPAWAIEAFYWALHAPGRWFASTRVSPDALTLTSVGLSLVSLPLAARGQLAAAAVFVLLGAAFDALDGMVARARHQASAAGAVLDSFVDRIADAVPLMGLVLLYRASPWALFVPLSAMLSSGLVSYGRAKAEIFGLALPDGLMRRHERVAYLAVSLLAAPMLPRVSWCPGVPYPLALAGPALIAVVGMGASLRLLGATREALRARSNSPALPSQAAAELPSQDGAPPRSRRALGALALASGAVRTPAQTSRAPG